MKVDSGFGGSLHEVAARARQLEEAGYDGAFTAETNHDAFLPLAVAATATERIELGTSIAVAFARTPMVTAISANDLQLASKGRFVLGLGSQIKPHIERRFSMPWSAPAARMREYVLAMRAIWESWYEGTKLDFRGDF
jgi:probable F420-dependent oxidoreductase